MGNVGLGVGYVTKIWRVNWEECGTAPDWGDDGSEGVEDEGIKLRAKEQKAYCKRLAQCDPEGTLYHWVIVRHYESGKVAVYVDGAFEGTGHASFSSAELKYRVGNRVMMTRIAFNEKAKFAYTFSTCIMMPNGSQVLVKELNETLMNNHDPTILSAKILSSTVEFVAKPGQTTPKSVVLYEVQAQIRGEEPVTLKKRFSEFVELDRLVRSAFQGSHLLSSVPSLPPKQSKVLNDHLDPKFIETRKMGLDAYVRKLLGLPRIPQNPDVLEFFGLLPSVKASSAPPVVVV